MSTDDLGNKIDDYVIGQRFNTTLDRLGNTDTYRVIIYLDDDGSANATAANITQIFVDYLERESDYELAVDTDIFRGYVLVCNGTIVPGAVIAR